MNEKLTSGKKDDEGKLRFDLIPPKSLIELAKVYTYGANKYGDKNWKKGIKWNRIFGAIQRHLWAFWSGEDKDKESSIHHLAHAAWGCFTLLDYKENHKDLDNRDMKYKEIEKKAKI